MIYFCCVYSIMNPLVIMGNDIKFTYYKLICLADIICFLCASRNKIVSLSQFDYEE